MAVPSYKLRTTLLGHSSDVRGVATGGGAHVGANFLVSGSRDRCTKIWKEEEDGSFKLFQSCEGHTNFVSTVFVTSPSEKHPQGLILSGSHDHTILAFELSQHAPVYRLTGHKGTVCSLSALSDSFIVSGSWDTTARVWSDQTLTATLVGHEAAVWAVAVIPSPGSGSKRLLTASADKTIRLWVDSESVLTFSGHTDCVRALAVLPEGDRFLSAGNDASVRLWSLTTGESVNVFYGHTNFIYSLAVFPRGNGDFASVGEDRTLRIWKGGETSQVIFHPATSVWSVCAFENGDVATGCSDGTVRVFTADPRRIASSEELQTFEDEVSKSVVAAQTDLGGMKVSELPGPEALLQEGREDGQTVMVRDGDKVGCFSWSASEMKWSKIGDVVGASGATQSTSGRVLFEGKEYDYVFTVDLDGTGTLKLPYNVTEDPWFAAQKFIHKHNLSQLFLDQVAKFIVDNTKGMALGQGAASNDFADPFTGGGRYVPGSSNSSLPPVGGGGGGGLDPFTGAGAYTTSTVSSSAASVPAATGPVFPVTDFVTFSAPPNYGALQKKLEEFIQDVGGDAGFGTEAIPVLLDMGREAKWTETTHAYVSVAFNNWPKEKLFPFVDLLRLGILNASFASSVEAALSLTTTLGPQLLSCGGDVPTTTLVALRLISNSFAGGLSPGLLKQRSLLLSTLVSKISGTVGKAKAAGAAAATILLNYSVALGRIGEQKEGEGPTEVLMSAITLLDQVDSDPEATFRLLVTCGNVASYRTDLRGLLSSLIGGKGGLTSKYGTAGGKVSSAANQLAAIIQ